MGGDSKFQQSWVEKGDRPWLQRVRDSQFHAFCTYCDSKFQVKHGGLGSVRAHENTDAHKKEAKRMSKNRQIVKGASNEVEVSAKPAMRSLEDDVLAAEVLQALSVVDKNQSFQSADCDNERLARQFHDSAIARNYKQGQTKMKYLIQFGIAPYVKKVLLEDMKKEQYCFHFDETTTSQLKKQYDGYITYYSKHAKQVACAYVGSLFVGHCPAEALLDHFYRFIEDLGLDLDNLLNIGMDGPNVNKKFEQELMDELKVRNNNSFISCGSCPLHTVHNAFGKGMLSLKERINLDQFVIDLHFFFERSAARREDFASMGYITDVTVHYLLRHCESRWLSIEKVLVRVIEQFANIRTYFLDELPKKKEFKGEKGIGNTKRYQRIAECLKDSSLQSFMAFVVFVAQDFKKFLVPLQTNAPMIHVLHSMEVKLLHALMNKFIDAKYIQDKATKNTFTASQLIKVDIADKKNHVAKVQVGAKATSLMRNLDALEKKKTVAIMVNFLEACTKYLLKNLPLDDSVLKSAKCLHPDNRQKKSSLKSISLLAQAVIKALGDDAMHEAFNLKREKTKYDLIDMIRDQFQQYQTENIPESFYKLEEEPKKHTYKQRSSYWKQAYEIAGICDDDVDENDGQFKRIDDYWLQISNIRDENGEKKYDKLWVLVKCVMLISHGNADPERGFSINKHVLKIHGFSLGEDTIIAIRLVKDFIIKCGGSEKVPVPNALLKSCKEARSRYHADLEEKRQLALKEEAARKAVAEAAAAKEANKEAEKKKDEKMKKIDKEIEMLESGKSVAELSITEANQELGDVIAKSSTLSKTKLVEKMTKARSKIDMGVKRKEQLTKDIEVALAKKRKI